MKKGIGRLLWTVLMIFSVPSFCSENFLILGDSLSAGYGIPAEKKWVTLLQNRFEQESLNIKVINASISGDTTGNGLARLPTLLKDYTPKYLLIALGGNDGLRGLPLSGIEKNLSEIITLARKSKADVFLVQMEIPRNYGDQYTQEFSGIYVKLHEKYGILLLPFLLEGFADDLKYVQNDGIHPTEEAQLLIIDNILPYLLQYITTSRTAKFH